MAATVVVRPASVYVKVGSLEICSRPGPLGSKVVLGTQVEVLINGEPFPVRELTLRIGYDEVVEATIVYMPRSE